MGHLPFLVVHGRAISAMLVASGGVLGVMAVRLFRTKIASGVIEGERISRGRDVGALVAGKATIKGQLRGRAATAVADNADVINERSDALSLDVGGTSVELRGDVQVIAGTRTQASWRRIPRGFVAKQARGDWRAYELKDGDEVIATGKLENEAGTTDGAYRDAAGGWVIKPVDKVIELCATRPVVQAPALHPLLVVVIGAAFALLAYVILWGIGGKLVDNHPELASAFPHVRGAALEQLDHDLEFERPRSEDVIEQRLELTEMRDGCAARARLEGRDELYDRELADACGDAAATIDALAHLGRYKEATAAIAAQHESWPARNGTIALAAGDWKAAADTADDLVRRVGSDAHLKEDAGSTKVGTDRAMCFAAWFRTKAGDPKATEQLANLGSDSADCAVMRAMALPLPQRGAALAAAARMPDDHQLLSSMRIKELAWIYGTVDSDGLGPDASEMVRMLVGRDTRRADLAWLSRVALETRADDAKDRYAALLGAAALDAIRGDFAAATGRIAEARARAGAGVADVDDMRVAVALHLPDAVASNPAVAYHSLATEPLVKLRAGQVPAFDPDDALADGKAAVNAAIAGDGLALARSIEKGPARWSSDVGDVLAVVPRVRQHREQVAGALRSFHGDLAMDSDRLPFGMLAEAAMRRDLARLAGDEGSAKHWQQLIDAQLPVLDDPDRVVALLLWQGEE